MVGFVKRLFGRGTAAPGAKGAQVDRKLLVALAGYLQRCMGYAGAKVVGRQIAELFGRLVEQGMDRDEAIATAMQRVRAAGDPQVRLNSGIVPLFLAEFVTAVLDALGEDDPAARPALLTLLSHQIFGAAPPDWDEVLCVLTMQEDMLFHQGWDGPVTPDEALDEALIAFLAANQAAKDFLSKPWHLGEGVEPEREVAQQVAAALAAPPEDEPLPETPALTEVALLRRRNPALWRAVLPERKEPPSPNATPQQIETTALAWLEALRGDYLAQRLLEGPAPMAGEGAGLQSMTPPLGVALVDFVLRLQHQVRPAFKAAARPVLRRLARRLSGAPADALVEQWIQLWKDLMLAYEGPRPDSLRDPRRYELLAYGQTRGRHAGEAARAALVEGHLAGFQLSSRDSELGSLLWRMAADEVWTAEECLAWPAGDPAERLGAGRDRARALLAAAGLPAAGLAAWDEGDTAFERLRAPFGYALHLFRRVEYVPLDALPAFAERCGGDIAAALERAASSWALLEGEAEGLVAGFLRSLAPAEGLTEEEVAALLRLLLDAANLPARSATRLQPRPVWLARRLEAERDWLNRPLPALAAAPPLVGSSFLALWQGEQRWPMVAAMAASLAADFLRRRGAGEALPRPTPEVRRLVEGILVFDPPRAAAYFERRV